MNDLRDVRDRVYTLPTLQSKRQMLADELAGAVQQTQSLLKQYEKEQRDVENLQKDSFSNYVRRAVGRYESRAEKEWMEAAAAKAAYDKAAARQVQLEYTLAQMDKEIYDVQALAGQYDAELQTRRGALQTQPSSAAYQQLAALEVERQALLAQTIEIDQASAADQRAISTVYAAADALSSAESWATWDIWGSGGFITHSAKYEHIDTAEALFNILAAQLWELSRELRDVQGIPLPAFTLISPGQRAVDFWLDNIFTDLSVRGQIQDNQEQLQYLANILANVSASLSAKRVELQAALQANAQRQEELLVSLKYYSATKQ